jgi:hypothetical protein
MVRKSPTESATLYKIGTKKNGNDGNKWVVIESSNGVKRWKLFKKILDVKESSKITKLGLLFLDFIEDDSLFPNSPEEVKNLNKDYLKLWKILKDNKFIEIIPKTKYVNETYSMTGENFIYFVNIAFEIANKKKFYYEPAKLNNSGKELIIQKLKIMKFIE